MPSNRTLIGAAAFSLALAGGGVAGALLGTPGLSGAQDSDTSTTEPATTDAAPMHLGGRDGELLTAAADALGMTEDELRTALADGSSIADVAEAQGVDVDTVVDALVAAGMERLQEMEANLPERMAQLVEREGWGDGPHHGGHPFLEAGLEVAADAIGISEEDLRSELRDGSTLAEVATAHDVDPQTVIDALVAAATDKIEAAVADGTISQERADDLLADLEARITDHVDNGGPHGRFGHGGPGGPAPDADPTADGATTDAA